VQVAQLAEARAERSMKRRIIGSRELFLELDEMTNYERPNKTRIALTQLHRESPPRGTDESIVDSNRQATRRKYKVKFVAGAFRVSKKE
jgi:hypothetical protein